MDDLIEYFMQHTFLYSILLKTFSKVYLFFFLILKIKMK